MLWLAALGYRVMTYLVGTSTVALYFTVTDFARLRGLSGSFPRLTAR